MLNNIMHRISGAFSPGWAVMLVALIFLPSISGAEVRVKKTEFRTCSQSMEVTDARFSGRAVIGVEVVFDDIGCAVIWRNLQCALDQASFDQKATVRDFNDLSILIMSESYYVMDSQRLKTPIGFGIAAFKDKKSAAGYISSKGYGKLLEYRELIRLNLKPPEPPEKGKEDGDKK